MTAPAQFSHVCVACKQPFTGIGILLYVPGLEVPSGVHCPACAAAAGVKP